MDRYTYQFSSSFYPKMVELDGYVQTGTTGAVLNSSAGTNLDAANLPLYIPKGLKSVVRNSTGNYTLTFGNSSDSTTDTYFDLVHAEWTPIVPAPGVTAISGNTVSWNMASAGTGLKKVSTVTVQFQTAGSASDPPAGGGFTFALKLRNSQV
jgi:hypothetical protein